MKNVAIGVVPFCYGPTAIAVAIGRQLKQVRHCELTAVAENPSLDLLAWEKSIFQGIVPRTDLTKAMEELALVDCAISVCDFEFAEAFRQRFPDKPLVFIDPLFWMWESLPAIIDKCTLYLVLQFPGVDEVVKNAARENLTAIPQIAEGKTRQRSHQTTSERILFNLGGMESPCGSNLALAKIMCEELLAVAQEIDDITSVDIRTSEYLAKELQRQLHVGPKVTVASASLDIFKREIADCDLLLTVPGMSIVYESMLAEAPTVFLLPLNYSQHLQVQKYRHMFAHMSEIAWRDIGPFSELATGLEEHEGVRLAQSLGTSLTSDKLARRRFREALKTFLVCRANVRPLSPHQSLDTSGALRVVEILQERELF